MSSLVRHLLFSRAITRPAMIFNVRRPQSTYDDHSDNDKLFEESSPEGNYDDGEEAPEGVATFESEAPEQEQPFGGGGGRSFPQPYRRTNKSINRVELLGGVGQDPTIKLTQRGSEFAFFDLFTNVDRKLPNGEIATNTDIHHVIGFGGVAKFIKNNIQRGSRIFLTGRLTYSGGQLQPDGSRSPRNCSIAVENIYPLARGGGRRQDGGQGQYGGGGQYGREQEQTRKFDRNSSDEMD